MRKLQNLIGGEHRDAADGRTSTLIDPALGEPFAEAPLSGEADVDAACQARPPSTRSASSRAPRGCSAGSRPGSTWPGIPR